MAQEARLNVRIDKQLLQEARIKALRHGTNVSHIVRDFLMHYIATAHSNPLTSRESQAFLRIAAAAGPSALHTIRGPIAHKLGFLVWHFTTPDKRGRVRCTYRDHLTGRLIPDQWEVIWIEEPLERQSRPDMS